MNDEQTNERGVTVATPEDLKALGLVTAGNANLMPHCENFNDVLQLCTWISQSNIVPEAYRGKPADIFIAANYGQEIGLPFMTSIQKIAIIGKRPSLPSDIKMALVRSKGLLEKWKEAPQAEVKQTGIAWCEMKRKGDPTELHYEFSIDDAKTAGLWQKRGYNNQPTPWVNYPLRMLSLKPRDMCLRDLFQDVFLGMLSTEEAQEIAWAEAEQAPEATLAQQSQPGTKGAEILQAAAPPLQAAKPKEPAPEPAPASPEPAPEPTPEDSPPEEPEPAAASLYADPAKPAPTIGQLVDGSVEQVRLLPGGGQKLMKLWQEFKLPPQAFGKKRPSEILPEPRLALFGNQVQALLMQLEAQKKK